MPAQIKCQNCGKSGPWKRRFCSKECYWEWLKGKPVTKKQLQSLKNGWEQAPSNLKKWRESGGIPWNKGIRWERMRGKNHPMWKDEPGYHAYHLWVRYNFGKGQKCQYCGKKGEYVYFKDRNGKERRRWNIDLANITGIYDRNPKNYMHLCQSCHNKFDKGKISLTEVRNK